MLTAAQRLGRHAVDSQVTDTHPEVPPKKRVRILVGSWTAGSTSTSRGCRAAASAAVLICACDALAAAVPEPFGTPRMRVVVVACRSQPIAPSSRLMHVGERRFDLRTIFVRQALQRVQLPDGTSELQIVEPKSDTSYRVCHHSNELLPISRPPSRDAESRALAPGSRW